MERLVRPFQKQESTPPRRIVPDGARSRQRIRLKIGGGTDVKTLSGSYSLTVTYYMPSAMVENTKENDDGKFIPDPQNKEGATVPQYYG